MGRKVELVFDPFDLTRIEVRYQHRPFGLAVPLVIGRHTHPQARARAPAAAARRPRGSTTSSCSPSKRDAEIAGHRIDYASPHADATATATATATIVTSTRRSQQ